MEKIPKLLRVTPELNKKIESLAKDKGFTVNALIVWILWEYMKKNSDQASK